MEKLPAQFKILVFLSTYVYIAMYIVVYVLRRMISMHVVAQDLAETNTVLIITDGFHTLKS